MVVSVSVAVGNLKAEDSSELAKTAYTEAKELFEKKKYAEAANKFRLANELRPNWKILYNIGQSEAAARRYGLALESFERFIVLGGDDIAEDRREQILKEIDQFKKIVGSIS